VNKSEIKIPFPPSAHVVAYLRDSGGDEQDLSVDQQKAFITTWCAENNLVLSSVFADVAQPGSSTIGREQFRQMIDHFRDPDCTDAGLVLWKFSRFSRDFNDAQYYRADLRRRGYVVHSIQDNIPDTTDGRIYEALRDWMNEKFLEDLSSDVKRGLRHMVTTYGAVPGTPPRGFRREEINIGTRRDGSPHKAGRWSPDPETWEFCKQAWIMRAQGIAIRKIHKELHLFRAMNSYTSFFTNRLYLGELRYGDLIIENYTEPMITQEIWDMVQEHYKKNSVEYNPLKRETNHRHPRRENSSFLLSGLLYCPRCESIINGVTVRSRQNGLSEYYMCSRANRNLDCDARGINKRKLEAAVIEKIQEWVLDPRVIRARDEEIALSQTDDLKKIDTEIKKVVADLKENERQRNNIARHLIAMNGESPTLTKNLVQLEADDRDLHAKHNRLKSMKNGETVFVRDLSDLEELSRKFNRLLTSENIDIRRKAIKLLVQRVVAERDGKNFIGMVSFYNPDNLPDADPEKKFMSIPQTTLGALLF
jgi:site-specific DNA recombinase